MYEVQKNQITFKRGVKPLLIRDSQRLVREAYLSLCQAEVMRSQAIALAYLHSVEYTPELLAQLRPFLPTIDSCLRSAARAYAVLGPKLQNTKMYSMNIYLTLEELRSIPGVPADLIQEAQSLGLPEMVVLARES